MEKNFLIDFIGIGAPRSGTGWLTNIMRAHPEICISEPKEIRYFNHDQILSSRQSKFKNKNQPSLNENFSKPLLWYFNHFRHCKKRKIKGEFTPYYLYDKKAPSRIKHIFPEIKLIVCLRNPIDRAYSHYWMLKGSSSIESITFEEAIKKEIFYIDMGFYSRQLKRYLEFFEREQILILLLDDIQSHPREEIKKVQLFLDVNTDIDLETLIDYRNPARKVKLKYVENILYSLSRFLIDKKASYLLDVLRKAGFHRLFNRLNTVQIKYPYMNPETRKHLINVFHDDINELEILLNRDLSHWK